jgi:hypothetical protein
MKNTNHISIMENQHAMVHHRQPKNRQGQGETIFSERDWGTSSQGRVLVVLSKSRTANSANVLFPLEQWTNRGENDGLDYFL